MVRHRLAKPWSGLESPRTFDSCILRETLSLGLGRGFLPQVPQREGLGVTRTARDLVLEHFTWLGGHADVWAVFRDGEALEAVVKALAEPFRDAGITAVCGVESRGFLLGAAVAVELGAGIVPVRKGEGLFLRARDVALV